MRINWQSISKETFLAEYWQKKPILLKNALPQLNPLIEPEEIAGLAMESFIESRVITHRKSDDNSNVYNPLNWSVKQGPIDDFSQFGESNWSLLVQGVDNWFAEVAELKSSVNFIPQWRVDDIMISFSTPGGGVGPHFDQYDVFIVQGEGHRRWQVGSVDVGIKNVESDLELQHVKQFDSIIDEEVVKGDILYIPPFAPHRGETISTSVAYSIGFRAPSAQELLSELADYTIDQNIGIERFKDTNVGETPLGFGLTNNHITEMQEQVCSLVNDTSTFEQFILAKLTSATRELNVEPLAEKWSLEEGESLFVNEMEIQKVLGLKLAITNLSEDPILFCDGESFPLKAQQIEIAELLVNAKDDDEIKLKKAHFCLENNQLVTTLINYGYFYIVDEHELQGG